MSQSRKHSVFESVANVLIGYGIGLIAQIVIFPMFGIRVSLAQNVGIGMAFTGVSLVRSYLLRRWFNRLTTPSNSEAQAGETGGAL